VFAGKTTGTLITSSTSTTFGQPVTLTDTVAALSPAFGTPTGTVTFNEVNADSTLTSVGEVPSSSGVAALPLSTLLPGSHTLRADYGGSTTFVRGTSNTVTVTVAKADTAVALTSSGSPSNLGQPVAFTATVSGPATTTPTGTVQFTEGSSNLGPPQPVIAGAATLVLSTLTGGTHTITAVYSGDANHNGSTGTVSQTVTCDRVVSGKQTSVTALSSGTTCLTGADVRSITVPAGAKLSIVNSTVRGTITARGGAGPVTICGTHIRGNLRINGASGFVLIGDPLEDACAANVINGVVTLSNDTGGLQLGFNHIGGRVTVVGNVGAGPAPDHVSPEIEANTIGGSLVCSGDSPVASDDGRSNSVAGRGIGECGAPGF
jgi:hypothetical protein